MIGTRFYGRMGNVLFQASHTIALALKHKQEFSFPNYTNNPMWNPLYLQHLAHPDWVQGREDILINENGHQYQEIEWREEWNGKQVVLNGYWQSEKYFKDYRNEILYLFDFPYEKKEGIVSIHIRRGDYTHLLNKHILYTEDYGLRAINYFRERGYNNFKVFSDDIEWCKQEFTKDVYRGNNISFSTNTNEVDDLVEMSCCEHHINSSSTFSWWGAWLNRNPDKIIVTPEKWFVDGWMSMDTSDIVPPEWVKL